MRHTSLDRLIAAAKQHDHPPVETTQRAWGSLHSAIEAGIGPSVPVVASASATTGIGVKGIVVVAIAVVMAGAAAIGLRDDGDERVRVAASEETPRATERPEVAKRTEVAPNDDAEVVPAPFANTAEAVPDPPPLTEPSRAAESEPRRREPTRAPETKSTLAEQAQLLGEAWKAVNGGRSARALELAAEHARRFPDSPLGPEREACRIVAWCVEDRPWAGEKARAFLAAHGGMPAARVRRACGEKE